LLRNENVTVLNQTPSVFTQLLRTESFGKIDIHSLRLVIFGGEALNPASLRPWIERYGDQQPQLVNMYGITETTVHVTYHPISSLDLEEELRSVIGKPLPDLQVYLLDRNLQPVPEGASGEIHIGGAGVARGYLNRPELTKERFIANPFDQQSEDWLYKSGDLARCLPNGELEYLGRIDEQVKIRGFRIEPGEIAAALDQHPSVRQTVVLPVNSSDDAANLVAFIVPQEKNQLSHEVLRSYAMDKLPTHMIPSSFISVDAIPLTPNGKVDNRMLSELAQRRSDSRRSLFSPNTEIEEILLEIWCEVLQRDEINVKDDFFELGGHSLSATQVISRVRSKLGVELPFAAIFDNPSVAELSPIIEALLPRG
jgi:acyl-CoA synthetase (AMP-forming)/AMP-acid ligase II/acyl carrier protein